MGLTEATRKLYPKPVQRVRNPKNKRAGQTYQTETRGGQQVHVYQDGSVVGLGKPKKNPKVGIEPWLGKAPSATGSIAPTGGLQAAVAKRKRKTTF